MAPTKLKASEGHYGKYEVVMDNYGTHVRL